MYRNWNRNWIWTLAVMFTLTACGQDAREESQADKAPETAEATAPEPAETTAPETAEETAEETSEPTIAEHIDQALAGAHRSPEHSSRDTFRNPKETLQFFGIEPDMTVVELYPGGGWYTDVLAPILRDKGQLIAAHFNPESSEYLTRSYNNYMEKIEADPDVYKAVEVITIDGGEEMTLGEPESADMVLTFRNMHTLTNADQHEHFFSAAYEVLKPGGVLGVVAHRADEDADPMETVEDGYLPESFVIEHAEAAGFELDDRADINANPADDHDHPKGVWTLPPSYALEDEDRELYEEIGESDRMTLRFIKQE